MRRFSRMLAVAALAMSMVLILPAAMAAAPVAGEVTGFVKYRGTELPPTGCANQTYDFSSVILNGSVSNGTNTFAGSIQTSNVYGYSTGCETLNDGKGTVSSDLNNPASFKSTGGAGSASGTFTGTYVRKSSVVTVTLNLANVLINGIGSPNVTVIVTAQFTPTKVNVATGAIQEAAFAGTFQGV